MPAFVTETLPEDLSVLVFSQSPVLADLLTDQLEQHGLEVTRKSSDVASLTNFLEAGLSPTWYKVFWIDDVNHISIDQAKKISRIFQEIKGLSYVVMHQPFSYQGYKKFELIGNLLTEIDTFFAQRSPYTSLLTYRDVLSNELFSLNYQQIIHFLNQTKFPFDPDNLSFINDQEMIEGVASLSFDPRGGKRRSIVSKKPTATKTILRAVQGEFRRRFKGEDVFIQNEIKVQFNREFKEFAISTSITQEELVSELIVEAKFHYKPEKVEQKREVSDIPRPQIPKPKPIEEADKPTKAEIPSAREEVVAKSTVKTIQAKKEEPKEVKNQDLPPKKDATELRKTVSELNLPLQELVPKVLQAAPQLQLTKTDIQESSIQIRVSAPLATVPKRAPVLIPETKIPEIKRSRLILHQLNNNLEKPVVAKKELEIPYLNKRIAQKVINEQKLEQERKEEIRSEDEAQKKLLEKKIATLFSGTLKPQKILSFRKPEKKTPLQILFGPETKVGKWYRAQKGVGLLVIAVLITTVVLVGSFFVSVSLLEKRLIAVAQAFEQGSVVDQQQTDSLVFAQNLVEKQVNFYSSIVGTSFFSSKISELEVSKKLTALTESIQQTHQSHVQALLQFLGVNSGTPISTLNPSLSQADNIYKQLSVLEAELKQTDTSSFFQTKFSSSQQEDFLTALSDVRREILVGQQLTTALPNVLTQNKTRTVAVVLQDSAELRATGGFINAVAILTISEGKLSDVKVLQPDEITLKQDFTPPEDVTEFLGEKQWFLRDGNWNPNFETTAKQLTTFIEQGIGTPIDAVIGINTLSLSKLLTVTGPLQLTAFENESVTDKNLSERELYHVRASLTDSDQADRPEFLTEVLKSFFAKLKSLDQDQAKALITVASNQLQQKELTLFSNDLGLQSTLGALGWTGTIISPPCPAQLAQEQCLVSSVFQVDSNVGVNKVNYSVKKKVNHAVKINEQKITHKREVTYENSSTSNSWPAGPYKNYIRWYVPEKAKLLAITVDGKGVPSEQIKQQTDRNYQVFSTLISVLPQTTTKVTIEYEEEPIGKQSSFVFFDQKQPGTGNTPTKVSFFYDDTFTPSVIAPKAEVTDNKIEFSLLGEEHSFVGVKFK